MLEVMKDNLIFEIMNIGETLSDLTSWVQISKFMLGLLQELVYNRDDRIKIETRSKLNMVSYFRCIISSPVSTRPKRDFLLS